MRAAADPRILRALSTALSWSRMNHAGMFCDGLLPLIEI